EATLLAGGAGDLLVERVHDVRGAVVERRRGPRARQVEIPPAVAREERDTAGEAAVGKPPGAVLQGERVVLGQALGDPVPVGAGAERLPDVKELVEVAARLVGGADRDVPVDEERVLARET